MDRSRLKANSCINNGGLDGVSNPVPLNCPQYRSGILVVDDDHDFLVLTEKLLEDMGFRTWTALDGKKAIELAESIEDRIDLVLLDVAMPIMDGAEAFPELRKILPSTRVVFYTGYENDKRIQTYVSSDEAGFICKGLRSRQLEQEIRAQLP